MKPFFCGIALVLCFGSPAALATEELGAFDPLTVRAGEDMRITLYNPTAEAIELRVFAYNAADGSYDEGPKMMLAAGKIRFFDFKAPNEFVGISGVIETTPEEKPAGTGQTVIREAASAPSRQIILVNATVCDVKSRGSLQHRTSNGQSQTMGFSFGATTSGGPLVRQLAKSARAVTTTNWIASPEL